MQRLQHYSTTDVRPCSVVQGVQAKVQFAGDEFLVVVTAEALRSLGATDDPSTWLTVFYVHEHAFVRQALRERLWQKVRGAVVLSSVSGLA